MDTTTISILLSGLACTVSVISALKNGGKDNATEGERWGAFSTEIKIEMRYIREDLEEIKSAVKKTEENSDKALTELKKSFKDSINHIHDRIDQHLREEHNLTIPKRKP